MIFRYNSLPFFFTEVTNHHTTRQCDLILMIIRRVWRQCDCRARHGQSLVEATIGILIRRNTQSPMWRSNTQLLSGVGRHINAHQKRQQMLLEVRNRYSPREGTNTDWGSTNRALMRMLTEREKILTVLEKILIQRQLKIPTSIMTNYISQI